MYLRPDRQNSEFAGEETPIPTGCKPTFTERPTIRQVEEGKITFECRLVGQPRPDVSWFHNEKKVEGRRHKVRRNLSFDCTQYVLYRVFESFEDNAARE